MKTLNSWAPLLFGLILGNAIGDIILADKASTVIGGVIVSLCAILLVIRDHKNKSTSS